MNDEYILAEYLRISEDDGRYGDSQSIEGQRALLNDFITFHPELRNARRIEFVDDGYSGTSFQRPAVQDMLARARAGTIHCIIVKDFSRFGRNYIDVGDYLEQISPFLRVRFISVNDGFDSDKAGYVAGNVGIAFKNLCNDYYCKDLSRKVRTGIQTKWETGKLHTPIYCRVASAESYAIETQQDCLCLYAAEHGYENITVYTDNGYSGINLDRPGISALSADVQAGKVQRVLVKDLSRVARNYLIANTWIENLVASGVALIVTDDSQPVKAMLQRYAAPQ